MPEVRKAKDGKYYVYRRTMRPAVGGYLSKANSNKVSKVFSPIKQKKGKFDSVYIRLSYVGFPKEFEGKHIQLMVQIVGKKEKEEDVEDVNGGEVGQMEAKT